MDFQHILDNIFNDLNEVRLHPRGVTQRINHLKSAYNGNLFDNKIKTREGVRALDDLLNDLKNRPDINQRLKWSFALHLVADDQASILGEQGLVTTEGTRYYKSLPDRVQQYAIIRGRITEIYEFGGRRADEILQELLIDDGLSSRKRRNTLLDPIYKYVGIGCSYHEKLQACTVIILAQDIVSLVAPGAAGKFIRRKGVEQGKQFIFNLNEQIMLNTPGLVNQNTGLQNALNNDINNFSQQNQFNQPLLNDLNNFQANMQNDLRDPLKFDMGNYEHSMQQNLRDPLYNDMGNFVNNNQGPGQEFIMNQNQSRALNQSQHSSSSPTRKNYSQEQSSLFPQGRQTVVSNQNNNRVSNNVNTSPTSNYRETRRQESYRKTQVQRQDENELNNVAVQDRSNQKQERKKCAIM